ncbi:MAG: hypothetical protein HFG57_03785 [Lachnospiraceae bacterium]|nr:hypothetical protein [Lachnospiraceae bacterium]
MKNKTENSKFKLPEGHFCANYCRDCRYIEMENNFYNDGTRRCAFKGEWVRPSQEACSRFEY